MYFPCPKTKVLECYMSVTYKVLFLYWKITKASNKLNQMYNSLQDRGIKMENRRLFTKGLCVVITGCLLASPAIPAMAAEKTTTEEVVTEIKTTEPKSETPADSKEMKKNPPSVTTKKTTYKMSTEWSDKFDSEKVLSHITLKDGTKVVMNDTKDGIVYNEADCKFNESGNKAITPDGQLLDLSFYYQTALYGKLYRPLYKDENGHYYISLPKMDKSGSMCYEYVFLEVTKDSETNAITEVFTTSEADPMPATISDLDKDKSDSDSKTDTQPVTIITSAKPETTSPVTTTAPAGPVTIIIPAAPVTTTAPAAPVTTAAPAAPVVTSSTSEQKEVDPYAGYDPTPALELMKKLAAAAATNAKPAATATNATPAATAAKSAVAAAKPATKKSDSDNKHSSLPAKKSLISADTSSTSDTIDSIDSIATSAVTDAATPLETDKPVKDKTDGFTAAVADAFASFVENDNLVLLGIFGIIIALCIPAFICVNKFFFSHE